VWAAAASAWAAPSPADLAARYPPGSITTGEAADKALSEAAAAQAAIDAQYSAEKVRCARVILITQCQNNALHARMLGQEQVHRVEVQAHDLQRKLAAQQRALQREARLEEQRKDDAARPAKEEAAHKAAQQRAEESQQRAQDAQRQEAQAPANREKYDQRIAGHERDEAQRASTLLRNAPENERHYQDKQAHAKAYATTRAHEREQNEKNRAERERKRKAAMEESGQTAPPQPAPAHPAPALPAAAQPAAPATTAAH
jgi:hypothetical protein